MGVGGGTVDGAGYRERLAPPPVLWVLAAGFVLSVGIAVLVPLGPVAGVVALLVSGLGCVWGLVATTARVEVAAGELRAGRAHIPVELLGEPVVLTGAQARQARGPGFDAAGYHVLRGWLPDAVRVDVRDPADPTPYWYVSTRRPEQLAAAIAAAQAQRARS